MSENQVPEDQMKFLRRKLIGNEAFGRLRGRMGAGGHRLGPFGRMLDAATSPTDFLRRWDRHAADVRVIGNLLARCRRDGWPEAQLALTRALLDAGYRLPGETVPLHETEPMTVVVFDFERTLTFMRWLHCAHWMNLNDYLWEVDGFPVRRLNGVMTQGDRVVSDREANDDRRNGWLRSQGRVLTTALFEAFPSLLHLTRQRKAQDDYEGWDLCQAYKDAVLSRFPYQGLAEEGAKLNPAHGTYNDHVEIYHTPFGFLVRGDQASVLSRFSREQQQHISTWTVMVPRVVVQASSELKDFRGYKFPNLWVGFNPQHGHGAWREDPNAYESRGCSNGYSVVIAQWSYMKPRDHTQKFHDRFSTSTVHLESTDNPLAFAFDTRCK